MKLKRESPSSGQRTVPFERAIPMKNYGDASERQDKENQGKPRTASRLAPNCVLLLKRLNGKSACHPCRHSTTTNAASAAANTTNNAIIVALFHGFVDPPHSSARRSDVMPPRQRVPPRQSTWSNFWRVDMVVYW